MLIRNPRLLPFMFLVLLTACGLPAVPPPNVGMGTGASVAAAVNTPTAVPVAPTTEPTHQPSTEPTVPANTPAPPALAAAGGLIFYLDPDGRTIYTIRPDGTDRQLVTTIALEDNEVVGAMSASADGRYLTYTIAEKGRIFLVSNGQARLLPGVVGEPRWHHQRFVAQLSDANTATSIGVFDPAVSPDIHMLGITGTHPRWTADGHSIVYLDATDNIWLARYTPVPTGVFPAPHPVLMLNQPTTVPAAPQDDPEQWFVSFATLAADNQTLLFAGGQRKHLGASGNGQQLWAYTLTSAAATAGPRPLTALGRAYHDYTFPDGVTLIASAGARNGPGSVPVVELVDLSTSTATTASLAGEHGQFGLLNNVSAPPPMVAPSSSVFVYGLSPLTSAPSARGTVYVWTQDAAGVEQNRKLVDGRFPVWIAPGAAE